MTNKQKLINQIQKAGSPMIVAHRGAYGANIPCNTLLSYKIAIEQGADVVELDVSKSADGQYYAFHPGMEPVFLKSERLIKDMTSSEVEKLRLVNYDSAPTSYKVPTLLQALTFLKGKCYINVDKFWTDIKGISEQIRKAGVEEYVIVKTAEPNGEVLNELKKYAPDLMYMALARKTDSCTDKLIKNGLNYIGTEILFESECDEVISDSYIKGMHDKGLTVWANSIVYNEQDVISAGHTDDTAYSINKDYGWGFFLDKRVDFIQTDWVIDLKEYIENKK